MEIYHVKRGSKLHEVQVEYDYAPQPAIEDVKIGNRSVLHLMTNDDVYSLSMQIMYE